MNDVVDLRRIAAAAVRWLWLLVLVTAGFAVAAYSLSKRQPAVYEATTTVMVGELIEATAVSRADVQTSEILARTYAEMALRQPVLEPVVAALGLDVPWQDLRSRLRISMVDGTQLLELSAEAGSTTEAREIADEVARQLVALSPSSADATGEQSARAFVRQRLAMLQSKIEDAQARLDDIEARMSNASTEGEVATLDAGARSFQALIGTWENTYIQMLDFVASEASPPNSLVVIEAAQVDPSPVRPRTFLDVLLGGALGFLTSVALVAMLGFRDTTLRTSADVDRWLGVPVLGTIGRIVGKDDRNRVLAAQDHFSAAAEAYRIVRSNIEFRIDGASTKVIVVTSPRQGEGKSVTVANLGIIMARAGLRTVIVDADLRNPVQTRLFGLSQERGLAEAIRAPDEDVQPFLLETRVRDLRVLASGRAPLNPAELLRSKEMRAVLEHLRAVADVIICDSPPAVGLSDAGILANRADGTILVVDAGQTQAQVARRAVSDLATAGANFLGVIVNRGNPDHQGYFAAMPAEGRSTVVGGTGLLREGA